MKQEKKTSSVIQKLLFFTVFVAACGSDQNAQFTMINEHNYTDGDFSIEQDNVSCEDELFLFDDNESALNYFTPNLRNSNTSFDETLPTHDGENVSDLDEQASIAQLPFLENVGEMTHISLVQLENEISLTKRVDTVSTVVGDIITYTVIVNNHSAADFIYDPVSETGGIWVNDIIPTPFRYVEGSSQLHLQTNGVNSETWHADPEGTQTLHFGTLDQLGELIPLDLPAESELELSYQLIVGSSANSGESYRNYAEVVGSDFVIISNSDYAEVRVAYDPVFDQGVLIGRAFCDDNGDRRLQSDETGLPGARIYLDTGFYTNTDEDGQFHFSEVDPGLHLLKIDVNTLPFGSSLTTEERRTFNVTRGTPTLIDFGVQCASNNVQTIEVTMNEENEDEDENVRQNYFEIAGSVENGTLYLEGEPVDLLDFNWTIGVGEWISPPALVSMSEDPPIALEFSRRTILFNGNSAENSSNEEDDSEEIEPVLENTPEEEISPFRSPGNKQSPFQSIDEVPDDESFNQEHEINSYDNQDDESSNQEREINSYDNQDDQRLFFMLDNNNELFEPLRVSLRAEQGADLWRFEVIDASTGVTVHQHSEEILSTPTSHLYEWNGQTNGSFVLQAGNAYIAQLHLFDGYTRETKGRSIVFGVLDSETEANEISFPETREIPSILINNQELTFDNDGNFAEFLHNPENPLVQFALQTSDGAKRIAVIAINEIPSQIEAIEADPIEIEPNNSNPFAPVSETPGSYANSTIPNPHSTSNEAPTYNSIRGGVQNYTNEFNEVLFDEHSLHSLLSEVPAAQINVQLPPQGVLLESSSLSVFGNTAPENRVWINEQEVAVYNGTFSTIVELPNGQSELIIETEDLLGNRGNITWPVEVASVRYFMMALSDTAIGTNHSEIAGSHAHNSMITENETMLYGQTRLYFKGWASGEEILNGYFEEYELTAHFDSGRRQEYEPFFNEIHQDSFYPVFGDASEEVADINARGKVYVLLTADTSRVIIGNYETDIRGIELVRYERNLYGAQLVFNDSIGRNFDTELRVHAAEEDQTIAHTYNYLRGTGGSLYYLSHRQIIEGSEQIHVIVRDQTSGIELFRRPLSRNAEYEIRYQQGRIILHSPLPSIVDDAFFLGGYSSTRSLMDGHSVYLEISYDYEGSFQQQEGLSYGISASETIHDFLTIGATRVQETRGNDGDYELQGVHGSIGSSTRTRLEVEYATSISHDLIYEYTDDGGLTYDPFRYSSGEDEEGEAFFMRGRVEIAELFDMEREEVFNLEAYYQEQDRGFFSNGTILDQGEEKFGTLARWAIDTRNRLSVRHDTIYTSLENVETEENDENDDPVEMIDFERIVSSLQYDYTLDPVHIGLSYQHTLADDLRLENRYTNDIVGMGMSFKIFRRLRLGVEQEIVVNGQDPRIVRGTESLETTHFEDRFITSLTAGYVISEHTELALTERFRYSGENATTFGMRTALSNSSDAYLQQRVTSFRDTHGTASSTVIGGEQRWGENDTGRSYSEYHMANNISDQTGQSVLGFGRTIPLTDSLSIDLAYEHAQTLGSERSSSDSSRDAASFGWEYLYPRIAELSGLLEVRLDHGSLREPRQEPCVGDDVMGTDLCRSRVGSIGDREQIVWLNRANIRISKDVSLQARYDLIFTENTTLDIRESEDSQASLGLAYRPITHNRINILTQYTHLSELAPHHYNLTLRRHEESHVFSFSPIIELPFGFQIVEKIAWRNLLLDEAELAIVENNLVLLINRLNYHIFAQWDISAEYRFLHQTLTQDWKRGILLEVSYLFENHIRLGVGFNFTSFAEDELGDFDRDASGVFFRVVGQY